MEALIMIGQTLLGLSIIITLHEFGHYAAARAFGMRVEKFYLFFDVNNIKLFSFTKGGTEYGIGWLPLGGYVKVSGIVDESMDKEHLKNEPKSYEYRSKPAWQRLIFMSAGVILNIILGILIFSVMTMVRGESYVPASEIKNGIVVGELGKEIGLQTGDVVTEVNGKAPQKFSDIFDRAFLLREGSTITVERDGAEKTFEIPKGFINKLAETGVDDFIQPVPRFEYKVDQVMGQSAAAEAGLASGDKILEVEGKSTRYFNELQEVLQSHAGEEVSMLVVGEDGQERNLTANVGEDGRLGFYPKSLLQYETQKHGVFKSFAVGANKAWDTLSETLVGLGKIFTGEVDADKSVQGPISIAKNIYGGQWDWVRFWTITALLSLVVGLMNILPIPALDGGHVMFLLIEMIIGRPLNEKVMMAFQSLGIILLIMLMVFVIFNDIVKNFF